MPPKEIQIPRELIQAIEKNELIVFVGAGLSWELKNEQGEQLEGWKNLVVKILLDLEEKGFEVAHLQDLIDRYEPVIVLNLIELDIKNNKLPKREIDDFIKKFIHLKKDNDFGLHEKIYQLSNKIITTNYDRAFEITVDALERNTAYKDKPYELNTHKNPRASLLFKLHGCYYHMSSMVLFPSQYDDLYNNPDVTAEHTLSTLKNIIYNKSVLFIGYGMGDFQINNIFSKIKKIQGVYNQTHFIVTKHPLDNRLDFLTPINIKEHNEIPRVINQLLKEKEKIDLQKTPEVQRLEGQLIKSKKQITKYKGQLKHITNDSERKDKLLERESLKYFYRGVELELDNEYEKAADEYEIATELNPQDDEAFNGWGNVLGEIAKSKFGKEMEVWFSDAFEKYDRAIKINPDHYEAYSNWAITLVDAGQMIKGNNGENLYNQAFKKYQKATEIKPDYYEVFNNWGNDLGDLAKIKSGKEAEVLYNQAIEKYQKAINIKPDYHHSFNNWGSVLDELANKKLITEAEPLYNQAIRKYQQAIEIKSDYPEAFSNLGNTLGHLAKIKSGSEAEALYQDAFKKYQKAIEIKPDYYQAFYNWGNDLGNLAQTKSDEEAETLYRQAVDKFQKAIKIKPDYHQAFDNLGNTLLNLAKIKSGAEAENLLKEALEKCKKAVDLGGDSYNLACVYALQSDKKNALRYLNQSLENKEETPDYASKDEDFKAYWQDKDFKKIIQKYKDK